MVRREKAAALGRMVWLTVRERAARPGRGRVPEPMVMDDPEGARAFHEAAPQVQMPVYELNSSMLCRLAPRGATVLDLGAGSGQMAAHLVTGRPDLTVTCVDLSEPMLDLGRQLASDRGLDQLRFVRADITDLGSMPVDAPDLVCCSWTLHQLPDRDTAVAVLREIARVRDAHQSAVWLFDFARLRRGDTMPVAFDHLYPGAHPRLRVDAVASEAAAWTPGEMRDALAEAGLSGLTEVRDRGLGLYQAWWATGRHGVTDDPPWHRPSISASAAFWADRIAAGMTNTPSLPVHG